MVLTRPSGPIDTTPGRDALEHRLDIPPPLVELGVLALHSSAFVPGGAGSSPAPRPRVERLDQRSELVARLRLDAVIEVAGSDLLGRRREHADRPRDALGEVEAQPRRADENHQRHHQEQRQVDALERPFRTRSWL
jgi:hypothetical protein